MAFGWRAHLLGAPADLAARLTAVLTDAQYTVTTAALDLDPGSITASERPDIVVFAPPGERDPAQAVSRWAAAPLGRRVGMALVRDPLSIDILSRPWSRLDLVADPAGAEAEISRWAQVEGRVASSPMVALVISADEEMRATFAGWLETAGIRPTTAADLREAMGALEKEQPDLILVDWAAPEGDVAGFVRRLRRMPRLALAAAHPGEAGAGGRPRVARRTARSARRRKRRPGPSSPRPQRSPARRPNHEPGGGWCRNAGPDPSARKRDPTGAWPPPAPRAPSSRSRCPPCRSSRQRHPDRAVLGQ
jgi:CheY-like chemotaxis protein